MFAKVLKTKTIEEIVICVLALTASLYHVFLAIHGISIPMRFRPMHLFLLLPIAFLNKAISTEEKTVKPIERAWLWTCAICSAASTGFIALYKYSEYANRIYLVDPVTDIDLLFGFVLIVLLIEATRRTIGWPLALLCVLSIVYIKFGNLLPGGWGHGGFTWKRIIEMEYMSNFGIFGTPLSASASFVFLFILFGAFLEVSGTGEFLINWASGVFGAQRGGPAKIAVASSGLIGMISGSPTSNVVTTGVFTIPMMLRTGYSPVMAGAIEATASTGGQIMPPIMGAAAFVLAEFTGTPYLRVAARAALPAILYYLSVITQVHFYAAKRNIGGLPKENLPDPKKLFKNHYNQIGPVFILVGIMLLGYTAHFAAVWAILSIPICGLLRNNTRVTYKQVLSALIEGGRSAVLVSVACATSGIIIGVFNMTGLAVRLTSFIMKLAGTSTFLALLLTMASSIILGMGIPTTAAYITCVAVVAPALVELGIPVFVAHMFVLYFAVLSSITPPVAIAAYAASGITKADPLAIGVQACRLGMIAFIVPYFFVYQPALLLLGTLQEVLIAGVTAVCGTIVLSASLEGWLVQGLNMVERLLLGTCGLLCIYPGTVTDVIGMAGIILVCGFHYKKHRKAAIST